MVSLLTKVLMIAAGSWRVLERNSGAGPDVVA